MNDKEIKKWNRKLGTSKAEQGFKTPKAPQNLKSSKHPLKKIKNLYNPLEQTFDKMTFNDGLRT